MLWTATQIWILVGEAIHGFLAVDDHLLEDAKRLGMAEKILHNWKVTAVTPENLVEASDRLRTHIEKTYGQDCVWRREWPIHLRKGNQKANGLDRSTSGNFGWVGDN